MIKSRGCECTFALSLLISCFLLIISTGCQALQTAAVPGRQDPPEDSKRSKAALNYIFREMDIYHKESVIYDEAGSGGEQFYPSGWMKGDGYDYNLTLTHPKKKPHSGLTCMQVKWAPKGHDQWIGVYWQYPEHNWGKYPGRNLTGATTLTFWARGETGSEFAEFKFGGINRPADNGFPHSDTCGPISTGVIRLGTTWKKYNIDLRGYDLSNIAGGFCWVTNNYYNPNGCTIYLDDISIDLPRLDHPRLIRSYRVDSEFNIARLKSKVNKSLPEAADDWIRNVGHIYDNALAVCAFLASHDPNAKQRARLIADAFVALSEYEPDGRLRNGYCCGDLFMRDAKNSKIRRAPGRLNPGGPGKPDPEEVTWLEDLNAKGTHAGNVAWAMLALMNVWSATGEKANSPYLKTARRLGKWVLDNCSDAPLGFGFTGGIEWQPDIEYPTNSPREVKVKWQSTEHNIDLVAAFSRLAAVEKRTSRKKKWESAADSATQFVRWAFEQGKGKWLITGTKVTGKKVEPNFFPKPLDPQTWSVLAYAEQCKDFEPALNWALKNCRIKEKKAWGYGFSTVSKDIWPEGTGQVAISLLALGRKKEATSVIKQLDKIQILKSAGAGSHGSLPAAYPVIVKTGFGWDYYNVPHIGATAWFLLAKYESNPFYGVGIE